MVAKSSPQSCILKGAAFPSRWLLPASLQRFGTCHKDKPFFITRKSSGRENADVGRNLSCLRSRTPSFRLVVGCSTVELLQRGKDTKRDGKAGAARLTSPSHPRRYGRRVWSLRFLFCHPRLGAGFGGVFVLPLRMYANGCNCSGHELHTKAISTNGLRVNC